MATAATPMTILRFTTSDSPRRRAVEGLADQLRERASLHVAHDAEVLLFGALRVIERDGRRAEDAEVLQQRLILLVVLGDVGAQEHRVAESSLNASDP